MPNEQDHLLSNDLYNKLKPVVQILLPALATLYAALAAAWNLPNPEAVVATLAALTTFGGVLLGISSKSWNNSDAKYDGELVATGSDELTGNPDLQLVLKGDPNELVGKRTVRLKPSDQRPA